MAIVRVLVTVALALVARQAAACEAKVSGAWQGSVKCSVSASVVTRDGGRKSVTFVLSPSDATPGVRLLAPASIAMPEPLKPGTYDLKALGEGGTVVILSDGAKFGANKLHPGSTLTITLSKVETSPSMPGHYVVSGTLRAHATSRKTPGAVDVEATF